MNILFIYSRQDSQSQSKPLQNPEQIQFGISYISSLLKKHGHLTRLLILTRETKKKKIDECLDNFSPKLICFTAVYSEYKFIADTAKYIKQRYPQIFLLAGGVHISLNPQNCLLDSFDALCIGEGEYPTLKLVEQLQSDLRPSRIPNLWIKHGGEVERNPTSPFLQDIDRLPFPDREMWQEWIVDSKECCSVLLGRGCPFQCTYCCNHALSELAQGPYVRFRSPENIVEEIKGIVTKFPTIKTIYLEVETISVNKEWAKSVCLKLEYLNATLSQPLSFEVNLRITPNAELDELFAAFKRSNFSLINTGLESGSERVRRQILKRDYSNQDVINAVRLARKYGLKICFYNLIGIPGETIDDFKETVRINRSCLPDWHFLSIFFPYPGTELYYLSRKRGLIKEPLDTEMERSKAILDLPNFNKKQIQKGYLWFDYYVYRGYKPLYKILARVLVSKIKTNYKLNNFYRNLTNYSVFKRLKNVLGKY